MVVKLKVFWDVTPCLLANSYRSFEEACCLHLYLAVQEDSMLLNETISSNLLIFDDKNSAIDERRVRYKCGTVRRAVPLSGISECEVPVSKMCVLYDMLFLPIFQPL